MANASAFFSGEASGPLLINDSPADNDSRGWTCSCFWLFFSMLKSIALCLIGAMITLYHIVGECFNHYVTVIRSCFGCCTSSTSTWFIKIFGKAEDPPLLPISQRRVVTMEYVKELESDVALHIKEMKEAWAGWLDLMFKLTGQLSIAYMLEFGALHISLKADGGVSRGFCPAI